jgi:hypothetical protein
VVDPVLRAWELDAALKHDHPYVLRFRYVGPEIVDRNPTPGVLQPPTGVIAVTGFPPTVRVCPEEYPPPPSGLAVKPGSNVEAMFEKWSHYKEVQRDLANTANFCLTALFGEEQTQDRRGNVDRRGILTP